MQALSISTTNFQTFAELAFSFTLTPRHRRRVARVRAGDGLRRRLPAGGARGADEDRRRAARGVMSDAARHGTEAAASAHGPRLGAGRNAVPRPDADLGLDLALRSRCSSASWRPRSRSSTASRWPRCCWPRGASRRDARCASPRRDHAVARRGRRLDVRAQLRRHLPRRAVHRVGTASPCCSRRSCS